MKEIFYCIAYIFLLNSISAQTVSKSNNWLAYMQKQSMHWDSISTNYYTGMLLGNGRLGTNIYKENETSIRFDIGRSDVTDLRPHYPDSVFAEQLISRPRLPIGKMLMVFNGKIIGVKMRLDLYNAEAIATIKTTRGELNFTAIVPTGEEVVHIDVVANGAEHLIHWIWVPEKSISPRISFGSVNPQRFNYINNPEAILKDTAGYSVCYQPLLNGGSYATAWNENKKGRKSEITISVGYQKTDQLSSITEAKNYIDHFSAKPIKLILKEHRTWWNNYFQQSFISIPDARMEGYYWMQLYNLASATRPGKPMLDLMGPWFTSKTPWPAIWWNLNTQLAYSPVFASNHVEMGLSLFEALKNNVQNLINNVPKEWRPDAAAIGRISGYDLVSPLIQADIRNGRFEPGNLTWILFYYYNNYLYTKDSAELKQHIYPLLKRSVNYLIHLLIQDAKGIYHLPLSQSPEYANVEDAHYTLSVLKWGLNTLLLTDSVFVLHDVERERWKEIKTHLVPYYVNETGFMLGKDLALTSSHRHFSHLFMIYPLREMSTTDPVNIELINQSVTHWQSLDKALAGYSYVGASSMSSLLGKGDEAYRYLNTFLNRHGEANGLYKESGPCFETPMASVTSLLEMLLQSKGELIKVFPAVPNSWKDIHFENLRTEGAFLISAMKKTGQTTFIRINSLQGGSIQIETDLQESAAMIQSGAGKMKYYAIKNANGMTSYHFTMNKNEFITIQKRHSPEPLTLSQVNADAFHFNYWGLQKKRTGKALSTN